MIAGIAMDQNERRAAALLMIVCDVGNDFWINFPVSFQCAANE
jgi:hypothetical protein